MNIQEMSNMLTKSASSNRGKYVPWWEDDFENCMYRYDLFSKDEIRQIEECADACSVEDLAAPVSSQEGPGYTLIHLLVWHNFYEPVKKALENGADANLTDQHMKGVTPLMLSCCRGNLKMTRLLLEHGADSSLCDANGKNSYHYLLHPYTSALFLTNTLVNNSWSIAQKEDIVKLLGEGVNQKDEAGKTPLLYLLEGSSRDLSSTVIGALLEKGADIDYIDEAGNTLLMLALAGCHVTAAFRLMEYKELVNKANNNGETPFSMAMNRCQEGIAMALKDHGAEPTCELPRMDLNNLSRITSNAFADSEDNFSLAGYLTKKLLGQLDMDDDDDLKHIEGILHNALARDPKCRVLDWCQEAGVDFTAPIHSGGGVDCLRDKCLHIGYGVKVLRKFMELSVDINEAVVKGRTPANIVASLEAPFSCFNKKDTYFKEAAQLFSKESMEQLNNDGIAAIHYAARKGHNDMLAVMLEKGVNTDLTEDQPAEAGNTALHEACLYGNADTVKLLMAAGADDSLQNVNGNTPAHLAVTKKNFGKEPTFQERAAVLKELKSLDVARTDGKTPLMLLQSLGYNEIHEMLPILLERGADVNHTDNEGNTALLLNAKYYCDKEAIKDLMRAGADAKAVNREGNNALYYALRYGNQEAARYLVKKGVDYNKPNNEGVSPMQIAVEKGYDTVLELMVE